LAIWSSFAGSILPWCVMMGATFPLMMGFVRQTPWAEEGSFSFLYLANVIGAMTAAALTALVLVEALGFRRTTETAAAANFLIALVSFALARLVPRRARSEISDAPVSAAIGRNRWLEIILFTTGFASLAMEVVWTRAFTFVLRTTIYSFAAVLTTYLLATWMGSYLYRYHRARNRLISMEWVLGWAGLAALAPIIVGDPRFDHSSIFVLASIFPFSFLLGYLTPRIIDEYSGGRPEEAGRSYAVNILGGILGPLFAAYILLPYVGARGAILVLSIPVISLFIWGGRARLSRPLAAGIAVAFVAIFSIGALISRGYEDGVLATGPREIRRDHVASVIAYGAGMNKMLMVNGIAITTLTPITKVMAQLPLAVNGHPKSGLDICFGMGTTFRSLHSWGIETTAVELSPSVVQSFGFFAPMDRGIVHDANVNIVVDDGRRYLLRSGKQFDVITIDPPPPVEAAGSSLLYSIDFYDVVKAHLAPGGILQQWVPINDGASLYAAARSIRKSFRYVVIFKSIEDWGYHFLASESPIPDLTPTEFVARLPDAAKQDLMEWNPGITTETMAADILSRRANIDNLLLRPEDIRITDDRPYNEYYFLRKHGVLPN
jgi:spermidine synthase